MTDARWDRGIDRWLRDRVAGVAPCAAEYGSEGTMETRDMTMGEAEAYRRGVAAAAALLEQEAASLREIGELWDASVVAAQADAIRSMEPGE